MPWRRVSKTKGATSRDDQTLWVMSQVQPAETARLEIDAPITCIAALPSGRLCHSDNISRQGRSLAIANRVWIDSDWLGYKQDL